MWGQWGCDSERELCQRSLGPNKLLKWMDWGLYSPVTQISLSLLFVLVFLSWTDWHDSLHYPVLRSNLWEPNYSCSLQHFHIDTTGWTIAFVHVCVCVCIESVVCDITTYSIWPFRPLSFKTPRSLEPMDPQQSWTANYSYKTMWTRKVLHWFWSYL